MPTRSGVSSAPRLLTLAAILCAALASQRAAAQGTSPPVDAESRFNTGVEHLRAGRVDLAVEEFQRAIKDDPKNPYFRKGLGLAYAQQKKYKEAVEAFQKALELNPYYVDVRNDLGTALLLSGRREEGRQEFLKAFGDPTNPTPELSARNLGQAYLEDQNYTQALSWFQSSLAKNNEYPDAYLGIADTLVASNRLDDAIAQLEVGARLLPEQWPVILALGEAYYRAGRFGDARPKLELVAAKEPGGPSGRRAAELLGKFPK